MGTVSAEGGGFFGRERVDFCRFFANTGATGQVFCENFFATTWRLRKTPPADFGRRFFTSKEGFKTPKTPPLAHA